MADNINNKQLFLKKLIYRSKYTGMKETDLLLVNFQKTSFIIYHMKIYFI